MIVRLVSLLVIALAVQADEPYRPQFHYSPKQSWCNDPNGLVFYDGEYHMFYQSDPVSLTGGHANWGHAVSRDLLHWEELPLALEYGDGVMIFSGSAVVDWKNSSGFGQKDKPPLVAIYTGHSTDKPGEAQHIAYSNDRGRTWTKYAGNPVLDIGERDFRDPKVFWHEPTKRWIMTVAWCFQRKVRFYSSVNLKDWTHLSDFGPAGSVKGLWECPDLFPLQSKWVLVVNVNAGAPAGGSGCQYFVGDFDGKQFVLDPTYPTQEAGQTQVPNGRVLADFNGNDYGDWKATGSAFGTGPARGGGDVSGFLGNGLVDSFGAGDGDQGTLTSPEFTVDADTLNFLIGGGSHPGEMGIRLLVDGQAVRTATGNNGPQLEWKSWDVSEFRGKPAQVEIFDSYSSNDWGHVMVDHVVLGGKPVRPTVEKALWVDHGRDCYAAVTWSDAPEGRRILLGWMSNWEYAANVPTSPWRGAMTVPRVLSLTPGLRLAQQPVTELSKLRQETPLTFSGGSFAEAAVWLAEQKNLPALLDIELTVAGIKTPVTLTIHTGKDEQTSVVFDSGKIVVDRTRSGRTEFHPSFSGRHEAPLRLTDNRSTLRLLLDTSSLEVFAQNGETVLTDLIFATAGSRTLSLTAEGENASAVSGMTIYPLRSTVSKE